MRIEIPTPAGPAWADIDEPAADGPAPWAALMLGHGAGGSVDTPDLVAVTARAVAAGVSVARVTQPYRVAGRRSAAPAPRLDEAWRAVTEVLRMRAAWRDLPVIHGGRSSGARVACRCAAATGAAGVIALAFPTHPPGRPDRSRADELAAVTVALLVVQGERDAFGLPPPELFDGRDRILVRVPRADHSLKNAGPVAAEAVLDFLTRFRTDRR